MIKYECIEKLKYFRMHACLQVNVRLQETSDFKIIPEKNSI